MEAIYKGNEGGTAQAPHPHNESSRVSGTRTAQAPHPHIHTAPVPTFEYLTPNNYPKGSKVLVTGQGFCYTATQKRCLFCEDL